MATYVAFLRSINLGATRKFPKDAVRAAVEAAGMTEVETYINTGNVRFSTAMRSRARIEERLEKAFRADRDFDVPAYVFTPPELVDIAERADELWAAHGEPKTHYVTLYKAEPPAAAVRALLARDYPGEQVVVEGRAAHGLMFKGFHESKALSSRAFADLGRGTARNVNVIRTLAQKWC